MNSTSLKSLWSSVTAFIGFWLVFLFGAFCNLLIPFDALRQNMVFGFFITDAMVELRAHILKSSLHLGTFNLKNSIVSALNCANTGFFRYFREIFVIVTLFHFTPVLQCKQIPYDVAQKSYS